MAPTITKESLRMIANLLGFSDCKIATCREVRSAHYYQQWLESGCHAGMEWMAKNIERRLNPSLVMDDCQSILTFAYPYGSRSSRSAQEGSIALYAHGQDYHSIMESKLADICETLSFDGGQHRFYVDGGPVMERDFAVESGLGWQGKSGLVLREVGGSRFFIGTILTSLSFEPDEPIRNRCGFCQRCLQICPTHAILPHGGVDARRCLSYWTIEHRGIIPEEWCKAIGLRLYGCDDCSTICPWTRKKSLPYDNCFSLPKQLRQLSLLEILGMDEDGFKRIFKGSPIKRVKWQGLVRNACIVAGNTGNHLYVSALEQLLSSDDVIAHHAQWALDQICQKKEIRV